jgi:hypothetical protein
MSYNLAQLKTLFRKHIKVKPGGPTEEVTRAKGLIASLDAVAESVVEPVGAGPVTGAEMFPNLEAGTDIKLLLTTSGKVVIASTAKVAFTPITENQYGDHPAFATQAALNAYLLTTTVERPAAPTEGVVDDNGNTFSVLAVPGYDNHVQYQVFYPGSGGIVPLTSANGYRIGTRIYFKYEGAAAKNEVGIGVAANAAFPAGDFCTNEEVFTGTVATTPPTNTTPDAPFPSYDPVTRVLTFQHALGTDQLEYNRFGGTFTSYAPIQVDNSSHSAGEWKARVKAMMGRNTSGTADSPAIDAKAVVVNQIPTANAGQDVTITKPTNSVALMGNGLDTDGTIVSYLWEQLASPSGAGTVTGMPASTKNVVISDFAVGSYQFELTVTDDKGATASDFVVLTVNAAPATTPAPGSLGPIDVYLIEGQSNAEGGADITDRTALPVLAAKNLTRAMTNSPIWNYSTNQFETLNVNTAGVGNQVGYTYPAQNSGIFFGPELALADLLDKASRKAFIIKYAYGGTRIEEWQTGQPKRARLDQSVHDGLAAIRALGYIPKVHLLWSQGEANSGDSTNAYHTQLTTLFNSFYSDWLPATADISLTLIRAAYDTNGQTRAAQLAYAAENSHVTPLYPETWPARSDLPIHYNGEGQYLQGKAFFDVSNGTYVPPTSGGGGTTTPPATGDTIIEETDGLWTFSPVSHTEVVGNWRIDSGSGYSGGGIYYIDPGTGGSFAVRSFTGPNLNIYAPGVASGAVKFDVYVDDVLRGTVSVPKGAAPSAVRLALTGLGDGNHVVKIMSVAAYNAFAIVDAIGVFGSQSGGQVTIASPSYSGPAYSTDGGFNDSFPASALASYWQPTYHGSSDIQPVVNSAGQVAFTPAQKDAVQLGGISHVNRNFTGRSFAAELIQTLNSPGPTGSVVFTAIEVAVANGDSVRWIYDSGKLYAQDGAHTLLGFIIIDPVKNRFLRLRDCGLNGIAWESSPDGTNYVTHFNGPANIVLTNVSLTLGVGAATIGSFNTGTAIFESAAFS